ncbi:beta strand repeat-containing protein [Lactococcus termiticola]|uniref:Gram-positive cocci surface proteins LPxTG domain-containing protein n=1 Tax=Lactococcus termiticola TaxID=2169526 RepID=A0A2R5HCZ5_9LACT|nr:SpaH/EbpB family LPXTG-anchored major pilin [Lactococcus termiticola]GBG95959.1 hypothetical protein NtB2_00061 [Lactococcus termiticola]
MDFKKMNKKLTVASVALLTFASLGGLAGLKVNAADRDSSDGVSNGNITIYAQSAAGNISKTQNITSGTDDAGITNRQTPAQAGNSGATKNDGTDQSSLDSTADMANVTFTATLLDTSAGMPTQSADGTINMNGATLTSTSVPATTNASGVANFTNLANGYYIISQTTTVNGITTVGNFIVQVNNNDTQAGLVNVYPKLDMSSSSGLGDVATTNANDNYNGAGNTPNEIKLTGINGQTISQSTVADQSLTNSSTDNNGSGNMGNVGDDNANDGTWSNSADSGITTTAAAGDTVNFNVNTVFDSSQTSNGDGTTGVTGSYVITDTLPTGVTYNTSNPVVINVTDGSGNPVPVTLTAGTDYTVTTSGQTVTITLLSSGQQKVAAALGNADGALNVVIPTTVNAGTVGSLSDKASTAITNAYGAVLATNSTTASSTLNVGGVALSKVAAGQTTAANGGLNGAVFALVKAASLSDAQALAESSTYSNGTLTAGATSTSAEFLNADGTTVAAGSSPTTVSSTNGKVATFTGLNLVDSNTDRINSQNYYAVEIVSPNGYTLPDTNTGANVFAVTADTTPAADGSSTANTTYYEGGTYTPGTNDNVITNNKPFALPFTGGEGLAAIVIVAAGAGIAGFVIRRRRNNEEEQA